MHPLCCESVAAVFVPLVESLRWSGSPEPDQHGVSFAELAIAFVLNTRSLLPTLCPGTRCGTIPSGQRATYTLCQAASTMYKVFDCMFGSRLAPCCDFLATDGQPVDFIRIGSAASLRAVGFVAVRDPWPCGQAHVPEFTAMCSMLRGILHDGEGPQLKRSFELCI